MDTIKLINIVQAATKLAEKDVVLSHSIMCISDKDAIPLYKDESQTEYDELWQNVFNKRYDYYYDVIKSCEIPKEYSEEEPI